ncbi:hypothetical protein LA6_001593 [Marinibacterium anthonyi]|nr:hypothetical protein LA6_001593 [Marinibacterium anthonyi]
MTKSGQDNGPGFNVVADNGSELFGLYVTYTEEGPIYDAVGIDSERDEFAIGFDDGCARLITDRLDCLALSPEDLRAIAALIEEAEGHFQIWRESPMGEDFEGSPGRVAPEGERARIRAKYREIMTIRVEV